MIQFSNPTICYCLDVDKNTIVNAILHGANNLNEIKIYTGACTGHECKTKNPKKRCCAKEIKELLQTYATQVEQKEQVQNPK